MVKIKQKRGTGVKTPPPRSFWCGSNDYGADFGEFLREKLSKGSSLLNMLYEVTIK